MRLITRISPLLLLAVAECTDGPLTPCCENGKPALRAVHLAANASGWDTTPVKAVIPLASGEKKTILILDKPGGGVQIEII